MYYFAYGSNMNPNRMKERGVNFLRREHATLSGWKLTFNKVASRNHNEGYANIERDDEGVVEGILYTIQDADIETLNKYEGYPIHYERLVVDIVTEEGERKETITYIANHDKVREGIKPRKDYMNQLLKGCDLLPIEYCKMLREQETLD